MLSAKSVMLSAKLVNGDFPAYHSLGIAAQIHL